MKILFVNLSALQFTVQTPDRAPLGGSESALCYLARALTARGHAISIAANMPEDASEVIDSIRHYSLSVLKDPEFFASADFDVVILCNAAAAAEALKSLLPKARIILWAHILPNQPAMQKLEEKKRFLDGVVFVSDWQRNEVECVFDDMPNATVIGNGIAPAFENMFASPAELLEAKENRAAYTTTPYRGLSVLLRAMQGLGRATHLDVFSSMRVYQAEDKEYADLFREAERNPAITCHGSVTQQDLAKHLRKNTFLFYPSIYPETFCITAAEAMAAGMEIITTRSGALPETTMDMADLIDISGNDGDRLVHDFRFAMRRASDRLSGDPESWAEEMFRRMQYANKQFHWSKRAVEWEDFLKI